MTAQPGRLFLLHVDDTGYQELGEARTVTLTLNDETVDITSQGSTGRFRELLAAAGTRSADISVDGILTGSTAYAALHAHYIAGTFADCQLESGSGETYTADFQVASISRSGAFNGEETFSVSLMSSGEVTYAAA